MFDETHNNHMKQRVVLLKTAHHICPKH